jgi:hypothetical protein
MHIILSIFVENATIYGAYPKIFQRPNRNAN